MNKSKVFELASVAEAVVEMFVKPEPSLFKDELVPVPGDPAPVAVAKLSV
jgi:hypothetical protein